MGLGKWIVGALGWAMLGPIGGILGGLKKIDKSQPKSRKSVDFG